MENLQEKFKLILICIALLITPAFFNPHVISCFDITKLSVLYAAAIGLVFWWMFKGESSSALKNIRLNVPIAAYFLSFIISTALSIDPFTSLFGTFKRYEGAITTLCYLILFYSIASIQNRRHVYIILLSMVAMSIPMVMYGIFQYYGHDCFVPVGYYWNINDRNRVFSTFGNSVFFAAYLVMLIPVVMSFFFQNGRKFWLFLPLILLLLAALSFTSSRAATIGLCIGICLFLAITWKYISKKRLITLAVTCAIIITCYLPLNNLKERFTATDNHNRFLMCHVGLSIIKDYPVFGIGPDCVGKVYVPYLAKYLNSIHSPGGTYESEDRLHADILDTLTTRGIFGFGTYIWLLVSFGIMIRRYFKTKIKNISDWILEHNSEITSNEIDTIVNDVDNKYQDKLIMTGLICGLLAWFIQNQCMFSHIPINVMWFGYMGLCVSIINLKEKCERN